MSTPSTAPDGTARVGPGSARRARWALALRLARREARRHPWRHALVVVMIFVPVAAAFATFSGIATWQHVEARQNRYASAGAVAAISSYEGRLGQGWQDRYTALLPAGAEVETTWGTGDWLVTDDALPDDRGPRLVGAAVEQVEPGSRRAARYVVDEGRLPEQAGEIFLAREVAERGPWNVGDEVESARSSLRFRVVGIGVAGDDVGSRTTVVAGLPDSYWTTPVPGNPSVQLSDERSGVTYWGDSTTTQSAQRAWVWSPNRPLSAGEREAFEPVDGIRATRSDALIAPWVGVAVSVAGGGLAALVAVVASAAFAIASRRQLRSIGTYAAAGADPAAVRAALVLQGAIPGLVAAVLAIATGLVLLGPLSAEVARRSGVAGAHVVLSVGGAVLAVVLGVGAGIGAAWQPARTASRVPVLSALAGRRPLGPVPASVPLRGVAVAAAGAVTLALLTRAVERDGPAGNGTDELVPVIALVAMLALVFGLIATAPTLVAMLGRLADRTVGLVRLALRGLARHRTQSAAAVAAVAVTLAIPVAVLTGEAAARDIDRQSHIDSLGAEPVGGEVSIPTEDRADDVRREPAGLLVQVVGDSRAPATEAFTEASIRSLRGRGPEDDATAAGDGEDRVSRIDVVAFGNGTGGWYSVGVVEAADVDHTLAGWAAGPISAGQALALDGPTGALALGDGVASVTIEAVAPDGRRPALPGVALDYLVSRAALARVGAGRPPIQILLARDRPASTAEARAIWGYGEPVPGPVDPTLAQIRGEAEPDSSPRPGSASPTLAPLAGVPDAGPDVYIDPDHGSERSPVRWAVLIPGVLSILVLTITLALRAVDAQDDHRAAVAAGAPPGRMRAQRALEGVVLALLGAVLAAPLGWLPVTAFRFGQVRRAPVDVTEGWLDPLVQRLHSPGWDVLPVLLAPAVVGGLLWLVVPAVRAALDRRAHDEVLPRW